MLNNSQYIEKLRSSGLRPTKQRIKICEVLFNTQKTFHFTINELVKRISKSTNVKILIKKTNKEVLTPKYKTDGSSGVDLSAFLKKKVVIKPNSSELIPTGLQVAIPEELEIQIRPRSGLAAKESIGVLNSPGTIDSDYRGELKIILFNHGNKDFIINNGDRIAQMVLVPILKMEFEEVDSLPNTVRGQGGFGSTGKKWALQIMK